MSKAGRPSVYDTKIEPNLKYISILRESGVSHETIASVIGIGRSTYFKHLKNIDEFVDSIKNGDEELVKTGKMSLLKLMTGYTKRRVVKKFKYINGEKVLDSEDETIEEVGPEPSSVYFGLVNKSGGEFKHRQEVTINDDNDDVVPSFMEVLKDATNKQ